MDAARWRAILCAGTMVLGVASAGAQQGVPPPAEMASQTRQLFEAGQYQQVVDAAGPGASPEVVFIAALSQERLRSVDEASALARRLAERPDEDPWHFIGLSLSELLGGRIEAALAAARRATDIAPMLPDAHYQLGLVLTRQQAWKEAAAAFDGVTALDPRYGYAYYYAGLGHYRANRPDLMAVRFEQFLKLAPKAPERPEVLQIMRTIRGR